jgi:hypothetical protein
MSDARVSAHFHGGPFDGETVPVAEAQLHDLVVLETSAEGTAIREWSGDDDEHPDRAVYRLSAEASGLEGDVEYAFRTPLDPDVEG